MVRGDKREKAETGSFLLMSTSFGKVIEINPASPTYLHSMIHFYFWQLWKCLCLSLWVDVRCVDVFYLHAHLCVLKNAYAWLCVCVTAWTRLYKQIGLWASEILQKSNAGLMPLLCDQRIRSLFHYLWRRNTFGCLPASLSHSHSAWRERRVSVIRGTLCIGEPFLTRWKSNNFGIQESRSVDSCAADSH